MPSLSCLALALAIPAQDASSGDWIEDVGLTPESGNVLVADGKASIDLAQEWAFLPDDQGQWFLEEVWGNPPDESVLGVVLPPHDHVQPPDWAVVVTYGDDGHVEDGEAEGIDCEELLASMQKDTREQSDWLREKGYDTVQLVGWAEEPHYDAEAKKLFWAKRLRFERNEGETLNYDVRILGREGVLSMNAVAGIESLADVRAGSRMLLERTAFTEGNRYEDFDPGLGRVAAYGIGGLIAGKVLLKIGFFKAILLFLAKGWKLVLIAGAGLAAFGRRLLGRERKGAQARATTEP